MAIFTGRYSWDGKKSDERDPISWFPGSYDLKIVDLGSLGKNITFLRPYLCIFTNTGSGYSVSANPEKFAKRICEDFSLDIEKVLWVEKKERNEELYEVITFQKKGHLGEHTFYTIEKRTPQRNELKLIQREISKSVT